jgi:hypothetical protein
LALESERATASGSARELALESERATASGSEQELVLAREPVLALALGLASVWGLASVN